MKKILPLVFTLLCVIMEARAQDPEFYPYLAEVDITEGLGETLEAPAFGTEPISYQWKKDGTEIPGATTFKYQINPAVMSDAGTYTLIATNSAGSATATITVTIEENLPPSEVVITSPPPGATFTPGMEFAFSGYGNDPNEDWTIQSTWTIEYHDNGNVYPTPIEYLESTGDGETAGYFQIPSDLEPSPGAFYRIRLTVRDQLNESLSTFRDVPWTGSEPGTLIFKTNPENLLLLVEKEIKPSRYEFSGAPASNVEVGPETPQTFNGATYAFSNWAHGGIPFQNFSISSTATRTYYTINYSSPLTGPWRTTEVGAVNLQGSAAFNNGTFTLSGAGNDIWNKIDAFRFVYRSIQGDVDIRARVTGLINTHAWAKAGVMIRHSNDSRSKHVMTVITPESGASFQRRPEPGAVSVASNAPASAPYWVRMVRIGNTFTSYISSNGIEWNMVGTPQTIVMNSTAYVGLVVTSHHTNALCTATFTDVSVSVPSSAASLEKAYVMAEEQDTEFALYPNPVNGNTLRVNFDEIELVRNIQVVNLLGQIYHDQNISPQPSSSFVEIDLNSVPKGVYLLRVYGKQVRTKSFMRQ